jgi:hypothetical protein
MMTVSRTKDPVGGIWVPFQSAVVLSASKDWDAAALQSALRELLAAHLTASSIGLTWTPVKSKAGTYFELSEARPLEMTVRGKICILSDDPGLMLEILGHLSQTRREHGKKSAPNSEQTTLIAGFDMAQERPGFARWSALVDRNHSASAGQDSAGGEPGFFSQNMLGLTNVFAPLESERMVESKEAAQTRQTVVYTWKP